MDFMERKREMGFSNKIVQLVAETFGSGPMIFTVFRFCVASLFMIVSISKVVSFLVRLQSFWHWKIGGEGRGRVREGHPAYVVSL